MKTGLNNPHTILTEKLATIYKAIPEPSPYPFLSISSIININKVAIINCIIISPTV